MSYRFPVDVSYNRLRRYCAQVGGGLHARPKLAQHVEPWRQMKSRVRAERDAREDADDAVLEASTATRVEDVDNDVSLTAASSKSWDLSNKNPEQDPHATLFVIDAKRIKSFGPARAMEEARRIVKDGRRLVEAEALDGVLTALEGTTERLGNAFQAYQTAEDALFLPRQAKKKLSRDLNDLIAVTEAAILTAFPGRDDLVSAVLLPWFERSKRRKTADPEVGPDPLTPDIDDPNTEPED